MQFNWPIPENMMSKQVSLTLTPIMYEQLSIISKERGIGIRDVIRVFINACLQEYQPPEDLQIPAKKDLTDSLAEEEKRYCQRKECGQLIKKETGKNETPSRYAKRKYCTTQCAQTALKETQRGWYQGKLPPLPASSAKPLVLKQVSSKEEKVGSLCQWVRCPYKGTRFNPTEMIKDSATGLLFCNETCHADQTNPEAQQAERGYY